MDTESKQHWEKVYTTKQPHEVSWTQTVPETSLRFIRSFGLPRSASVIDIGGGDSRLADFLLDEGYEDITVLDISEKALDRAKARLGERSSSEKWIVSDIRDFKPERHYDIWHDRAAFHFLTRQEDIAAYLHIVEQVVDNFIVIGSFSDSGPEKCSGLYVCRYNEPRLETMLSPGFEKIECITEDHLTPFNTTQNFLFCAFKKN